jgi:hypothetical protein
MTPIVGNSQSPTILPAIAPPSPSHGRSYAQVVQPTGVTIPLVLIIVIAIDPCGTGKNWRKVTIEMLPDDTRVWPTLPVVVHFEGRSKSKSLPKNVVVALRQADRICKIDLSVPTLIRQSIADMMQVPFPALESIRIESKSASEPLVIDELLGGSAPRLKEIRVEGFAIPFLVLRRLLLSTHNLVTLNLYDIPESCSLPLPPDAFVTALSSLSHLKELSIRFRPPASRRSTTNT